MTPPGKPLVSVAIIAFNQEEFIEECVNSVIAQTYRPIQIVVADDGSSDRTCAIVAALSDTNPGLIVLARAERQGGITANQNLALAHATGKYVAWLGGDDIMLPEKIARQVDLMESDPDCAICYHDQDVFDSATGQTIHLFSERNRPRQGDVRAVARYGCFNGGSSTMVRSAAGPLRFDTRIAAASDWLFWLQTLCNGGRIRYIDEVLTRYRRHSGNVTGLADRHRALVLDHIVSAMVMIVERPALAPDLSMALARSLVSLARRTAGPGRWSLFALGGLFLTAFVLLRPLSWALKPARKRGAHREKPLADRA